MKLEEDGTPLLFFDQKWSPICGHSFWDDNHGATSFCKQLGYESGTVTRKNGKYPVASLRIGRCRAGEELTACTHGGNYLNHDRLQHRYCYPQETVSISIACDQQAENNSTCNAGKSTQFVDKLLQQLFKQRIIILDISTKHFVYYYSKLH